MNPRTRAQGGVRLPLPPIAGFAALARTLQGVNAESSRPVVQVRSRSRPIALIMGFGTAAAFAAGAVWSVTQGLPLLALMATGITAVQAAGASCQVVVSDEGVAFRRLGVVRRVCADEVEGVRPNGLGGHTLVAGGRTRGPTLTPFQYANHAELIAAVESVAGRSRR